MPSKYENHQYPAAPASLRNPYLKPSTAQKIVLRGIENKQPFYVTPYLLLGGLEQSNVLNNQQTDFVRDNDFTGEIGGDIKYSLTDDLTLDITVNTDFAQAEAGNERVKLTRFPLFFPEKRRFFQERSGIFEFNTGGRTSLFFSRRELARWLIGQYRVSEPRGARVTVLARSTFRYRPVEPDDEPLRARIREIAMSRVRYGFWRTYVLLRREGWLVNHKRVYRLYKLEGLNLRSKRPRRSRAGPHRLDRPKLSGPHQLWSMDFVADQLFDGRRFRALTVVDNLPRRCLAIQADQSIKGTDVTGIMEKICCRIGQVPRRIQVDNGSEFISKALDQWAYDSGVTLGFSRPGKPTDNPYIESFNGSFRDKCLNLHWFL